MSPSRHKSSQKKALTQALPVRLDERSFALAHTVGWGLLVFAVIQCLAELIPFRYSDFNWRMETMISLVSITSLFMIGLVLVFLRRRGEVSRMTFRSLRLASLGNALLVLCYGAVAALLFYGTVRGIGRIERSTMNELSNLAEQEAAWVEANAPNRERVQVGLDFLTEPQQLMDFAAAGNYEMPEEALGDVEALRAAILEAYDEQLAEEGEAFEEARERVGENERRNIREFTQRGFRYALLSAISAIVFGLMCRVTALVWKDNIPHNN